MAGEVGLIYASDLGYAVSDSPNITRNNLLNQWMSSWNANNLSDWLLGNSRMFTISPSSSDSNSILYFDNLHDSFVFFVNTSQNKNIYPVVYINTSTKIVSGTGTSSNPYILEA